MNEGHWYNKENRSLKWSVDSILMLLPCSLLTLPEGDHLHLAFSEQGTGLSDNLLL